MQGEKLGRTLIAVGIVVLIIAGIVIFGGNKNQQNESAEDTVQTTNQLDNQENTMTTVTLQTTQGAITLELFDELAPKTVENFTKLASEGFYDGVRFHRVIPNFMIQSGDPLSKDLDMQQAWGTGGPGYTFADEIHAENKNVVGTISMANAGPNTNGSQFFINVADNNFLDTKHTVFGRVTSGLDVVQAISETPTEGPDRPIDEVVITSVTVN